MLDDRTVVRLLNEEHVADRVKVEDLLSIRLECRPAALLVVPAEFPGGIAMGQSIDQAFSRSYMGHPPVNMSLPLRWIWQLQNMWARATKHPMAYRGYVVRDAFVRVVHASDSYRSLWQWIGAVNLKARQFQLRPTIDEIYTYREVQSEAAVSEIQSLRARIRHEFLVQYRHEGGQFQVFPEEYVPEFGRKVGQLLGYPECCVERYVGARSRGERLEELAAQEAEAEREDDLGYFARDFIPCHHSCQEARGKGREILDRLEDVDPRLADLQLRAYRDNAERVRKFPEIIKERQEQIQKRWGDMWFRAPDS